jgi:D-3-phosphoglycerate dehydrogenase
LSPLLSETVNYVNAPALAEERGLVVAQTRGLELADYPNMLSCRVSWDGGQRVVAGTLFGGVEGRIVQMDQIRMDVRPQGHVLVMLSQDVPGVIGAVGTLLGRHHVNIASFALGRNHECAGCAIGVVNVDETPGTDHEGIVTDRVLAEIRGIAAIQAAWRVRL